MNTPILAQKSSVHPTLKLLQRILDVIAVILVGIMYIARNTIHATGHVQVMLVGKLKMRPETKIHFLHLDGTKILSIRNFYYFITLKILAKLQM